jgi:hypothetical protein
VSGVSERKVVKQLSVFIANEAGRVSEVTGLLGEAGVNIRGFSVSDTIDYGILRLVVDRPAEAMSALKSAGFTVREDEVICIDLPDQPGGLAGVLRVVADAGVNIEYVYSLVSTFVVINVGDVDQALQLLGDRPVHLMSQEDIAAVHM